MLLQLDGTVGGSALPLVAITAALVILVIIGLVGFFVSRYKLCPANEILVISGTSGGEGRAAKIITNGGAIVWPVVQKSGYMSLLPLRLDIPLNDALSLENIRVAVPSVFTIAIGTDVEIMQNAAMRLLGLSAQQIEQTAHDIIVGQMRAVISALKIDEINRDREALLQKIQHQLEPELKKIGIILVNVNITDLRDSSGYLEALGKRAAQEAIQQARGDVADQQKLGEIRVAEADRDQKTAVAVAEASREIGLRAASLEQAVKVANLDKEQQIAEQTAMFQREAQVAEAEQTKRVAVATANATAVAGEADALVRIAVTQSALKVAQADAYRAAETRQKEAEAFVAEAQNRAQVKAALANAERVEAEQRAKVEAPAKADKARIIVEAEAAAEKIRLAADADAHAIRVKLEAQAEGEYLILSKRSEALGQLVDKAGGAREAFQLLLIDQLPLLADASAKAISNIKFDKIVVWEGGGGHANGDGEGVGGTAGFLQNLTRAMPPMMNVLREIGGVELPAFLGKMNPDAATDAAAKTPAAKPEVTPPTA